MPTLQPSFWCVANIGDVNPLNHGGAFVLVDRRGSYCPELRILEPMGEDSYGDPTRWLLHTVLMEDCTVFRDSDGRVCVSDNRYHPTSEAWFGRPADLASLAGSIGERVEDVARLFMGDILERAVAWKAVNDHWGPQTQPEQLNKREASSFCRLMLRQLKAAEAWHDGTSNVKKR